MEESKMSCLIVEDEPLAAEILKDYISSLPGLDLFAHCCNAIDAISVLQHQRIDLIFLDIHLPKLKGFDFLKTLTVKPHVIITSAYHEYALKGFEYNVVDYLLKPIEFSRFLSAINKIASKQAVLSTPIPGAPPIAERKYLFFNVGKKHVKVFLDEVSHVESVREYVKIFCDDKCLVTRLTMGAIEQEFIPAGFIRIHRSYLVNIHKIDSYAPDEVSTNGVVLPVSRSYKDRLQLRLPTLK